MPDVGDVLGDEGLTEVFDSVLEGLVCKNYDPSLVVLQEQGRSNYMDYVDYIRSAPYVSVRDDQPFISLCPPPTHLQLNSCAPDGRVRVHSPSLEHWLSSPSSALSFLQFTHEGPDYPSADNLLDWLCPLLHTIQPQEREESHLRTLALPKNVPLMNAGQVGKLVSALEEGFPCSKLEHLMLAASGDGASLSARLGSFVRLRCRSLVFILVLENSTEFYDRSEYFYKILSNFLGPSASATDTGMLRELRLMSRLKSSVCIDGYDSEDDRADYGSFCFRFMNGMTRWVSEVGSLAGLRRLDIRGLPPFDAKEMAELLDIVASPRCAIYDLGINLGSLAHEDNEARYSTLSQRFKSGSSLSKLKALRVSNVHTNEAKACLVEILDCADSKCKVRFLDIDVMISSSSSHNGSSFFWRLRQVLTLHIECLRALILPTTDDARDSELSELSSFLHSQNCSRLVWLQCKLRSNPERRIKTLVNESLQMDIANALEANWLLLSLHISALTSFAARSRAATFLARNRRYKAIGISNQRCIKPWQTARVFVCGNRQVGKTALSKSLVELHNGDNASRFSKLLNVCRCSNRQSTRVLDDIHQLSFESSRKLVIFDLGGQPDYHVFNRYVISNTSHADIFIVICKYTTSTQAASQLVYELEDWLEVIVSHHKIVGGPLPKVMLVVNFYPNNVDMRVIAENLTRELQKKYAEKLDFGNPAYVFGIVAPIASQTKPILETLKRIVAGLPDSQEMISELCLDIYHTLHELRFPYQQKLSLTSGNKSGLHHSQGSSKSGRKAPKGTVQIVDYAQVRGKYILQKLQQREGKILVILDKRIQAALEELHNMGEVVYFPAHSDLSKQSKVLITPLASCNALDIMYQYSTASTEEDAAPIIIDPNWFYYKLMANLLAHEDEFEGKFERTHTHVRQVLMKNGCPNESVDHVLRYMQGLEVCYVTHDDKAGEATYFFPALATNKKVRWPRGFYSDSFNYKSRERNITCKYRSERKLVFIPMGVFARLQVKLQEFCVKGNGRGFNMGYHWASFVMNSVEVMITFGREGSVLVEERAATIFQRELISAGGDYKFTTIFHNMREDEYPEWMNISLSWRRSSEEYEEYELQTATAAEDTIMNGITKFIFDICQATSRGVFPTVELHDILSAH